ncbi:hypothetical protein BDR26DRAFT_799535 [Obelidium mucronatum]|nr:hypothetical protein BDR26DRAFT_799535 [Obelidium mucronatum]
MNPSSRPSTRPGSRSGSRFVSSDNLRAPPVAVNDNGEESSQVTSLGSQPLGPNVATKQASNSNNTATNSDPSLFYLPIEYTSITGHRFSSLRLLLYVFLSIMTCGLLPFACLYLPWLRTYLIRESCSHFRDAQFVLVLSSDGTWHELKVSELSEESHLELNNPDTTTRTYKYFQYRKQRYVFQEGANTFVRINSRLHVNFESLHPLRYGLSEQEAEALLSKNGENIIDVETVPILKMLLDKVVHPFYLFQAASVLIWTYESYFLYSYIIAFTSISSIIWEIYLSKRNEHSLRSLLKEEFEVFVLRSNGPGTIGVPTLIQARHLVVGDAILLDAESSTTTAMADVVLLQGSCVVDESSLTGESVPVVKTSLGYFERRGELFSADKCKNSIVYAGSKIVEFKPQAYSIPDKDEDAQLKRVVGVVIATGFNSTKGQLFRGILYPNRVDIKFYKDALIFIGTLGLIAIAAFTNRLIHGLKQGYGTFWVVITSLDIITIAVPPALPLVLTVGVSQALRRLKKNGIFCIAPDRINYAGRIDLFCWDKTGTLTTSKVTWAGVEKSRECTFTGFRPTLRKDGDGDMERAIAACHSLNLINDELVGSTVDVELFEATKFRLAQDEPTAMLNGHIFPVIARVYKPLPKLPATPQSTPRSPNLPDVEPVMTKPLSIQIPKPTVLDTLIASPTGITPTSGAKQIALPWEALTVVTKGSPETIRNICKQSTIPSDYHATYTRYATAGWYVLALASNKDSTLKITTAEDLAAITRDQVERDLKFLGFVLLKNPLKSESQSTVSLLTDAGIKSVIITGDNVMTGISVARQLSLCKQVLLVDVFDGVVGFRLHHAVSTSELTNSDEDSIGPQSLHLGTNPASVPRIRIRSATTTSNGSAAQRHQQEVKDSFKVYPLDQIARMQNEISDSAEIAITGPALDMFIATREGWKENLVGEKFLDWLVLKGVVFARMKPDQKTWIIERMMKLGKYVGMCGDGANDTGALKAAHVGLALSDAEASIVAPFTSGQRKVADVVRLIREGRCALDINFMAFKFMFMYPLIQLSMMATLTQVDSGLSNNQYLFDDLFVVLTLAFFMLRSSASRQLAPHRPTDDLLSAPIIYSLIGQVAICSGFFAVNYYSLISEDDWFCSIEIAKSKLNSSWMPINTTASLDVSYPCYPLAFIFTSPHRKPLYTNILYILTFLTVSGVMVLMQLSWEEWQGFDVMQQIFSIREGVQWGHRIESLYLAATNLLVSLVWETIVIDRFVRRWVESRETMDHKKLENRIGKQAGVLSANEGSEQLRNKRNYLQQFGIITGIMNKSAESRTGGGDGSVAWEGYVQTVVSATAGKHLDTRLDMAAHLKNTRSWGDMNHQEESMRVSSTPDGEQLGSLSIIGDRFEVEDGKDDGFDKGFDAWREGRRQTLK